MNTHPLLQVLEQQIAALASGGDAAWQCPLFQARFDPALFANPGTQLRDYLAEVQKNFTQLQTATRDNRINQVAYLAKRLVTQIAALKRKWATQELRRKNQPKEARVVALYHTLTAHQDYERRLTSMMQDRENLLRQQSKLAAQQKMQYELAVLAGRLMR